MALPTVIILFIQNYLENDITNNFVKIYLCRKLKLNLLLINSKMVVALHDSFIMRQGYAGDLEEAMRRAFYDEFQSDIPIKHEVIVERATIFEDDGTPRTEAVTKDDREHSQWYDRNTMWLSKK